MRVIKFLYAEERDQLSDIFHFRRIRLISALHTVTYISYMCVTLINEWIARVEIETVSLMRNSEGG